jgi:hypothetical protein
MADPRASSGLARAVLTLAALAATLGGWLAMAAGDRTPTVSGIQAIPLPPIPDLEPGIAAAPLPARPRPAAITRTRSSR